jgi:hypothetical protein
MWLQSGYAAEDRVAFIAIGFDDFSPQANRRGEVRMKGERTASNVYVVVK